MAAEPATRPTPILSATGLSAGYHGHPVVHDLEVEVYPGEVVALLGPNGVGKTTTLLALAGYLKPLGGEIRLDGDRTSAPLHWRAGHGLALVTEERSIFKGLTTMENLRVGRCDVEAALTHFPELRPLLKRPAGLLSGGEQQMLTLARALARRPSLLLADELSLGLAPLLVERLLRAVREAADEGLGVVLVEQHLKQALRIADRAYVMRRGRIVLAGAVSEITAQIEDAYFGDELTGSRSGGTGGGPPEAQLSPG